jgi:hypothetical protein
MARPRKIVIGFNVGDKVKLTTNQKAEGVIVHRHSVALDGREWNVHWYNVSPGRGIYSSTEIQKYY